MNRRCDSAIYVFTVHTEHIPPRLMGLLCLDLASPEAERRSNLQSRREKGFRTCQVNPQAHAGFGKERLKRRSQRSPLVRVIKKCYFSPGALRLRRYIIKNESRRSHACNQVETS